jgi:hypothetical protein
MEPRRAEASGSKIVHYVEADARSGDKRFVYSGVLVPKYYNYSGVLVCWS